MCAVLLFGFLYPLSIGTTLCSHEWLPKVTTRQNSKQDMPAAVRWLPPTPPSTNLEDLTYNKGPFFLVIVATLVSIALLIFLLRVYTRIRLLRFFGIDDWLMLVAVVST